MSRIRTVKPELFKHQGLFDLEITTKLPIRLAFIGLLTCCDREGRFKWQPTRLKLDMLPYDKVNIEKILEALADYRFIEKYEYEGRFYGLIPSFAKHQLINNREMPSNIPAPTSGANANSNITSRTTNTSNLVKIIFEHWKYIMRHPQAKLDLKRNALIINALNLGYSEEELCQAITGCSLTPYNMGDNQQGQLYNGLHIILRDANQIDRFIHHHKTPPQKLKESEKLTKNNIQTVERWLNKKLEEGAK